MQQHEAKKCIVLLLQGPIHGSPQKRCYYYYVVIAQDESIAVLFHAHAGNGGRMDLVEEGSRDDSFGSDSRTAGNRAKERIWEARVRIR